MENQKTLNELLISMFNDEDRIWKHTYTDWYGHQMTYEFTPSDLLSSLMSSCDDEFNYVLKLSPEFQGIEIKHLDNYGGEDMGAEYWAVWEFTKGNEKAIVKFEGYYQSHYGTDFQGWKFVKPEQKMTTIYVDE